MSLKILFVTQSLGKGGAERLVLEMAHALKNSKSDVVVKILSLDTLNDYPKLSQGLDIKYCNSTVRLSLTGKNQISISEYEAVVNQYKPDVIHSHTYKAELVSREKPRIGIIYITHVHGPFPEFEPLSFKTFFSKQTFTRYYERRRMFKRYKKINNQFITISSSIDNQLRGQLPSSWSKRIHLLPNAIDFYKFNELAHPPESNEIRLVSVGRLYPIKNHKYLIEALHFLRQLDKTRSWNLTIVGDGPLRAELESFAKQLSVFDQIEFTGQRANVQDYLKKGHLYVQSSKFESFGLSLIEAMASSLPVVSLDGGGNRDFIVNNQNGFLLSQDTSPEEFARKILEVIADGEAYIHLAKTANETARQYDIKNYVDRLTDLYNA